MVADVNVVVQRHLIMNMCRSALHNTHTVCVRCHRVTVQCYTNDDFFGHANTIKTGGKGGLGMQWVAPTTAGAAQVSFIPMLSCSHL